MGNQGGGELGNELGRCGDERGEVVLEAGAEPFQQLHTGVHDLVGMVAEVLSQRTDDLHRRRQHGLRTVLLQRVCQGKDGLVCPRQQLRTGFKKGVGQRTEKSTDIVLQGGESAVEGLAGLQHTVVELPALAGGGFYGLFQFAETDFSVRNALIKVGHGFAGGVADLVQRVEARVDHHVDVFQRDLLCRGHFAIGPDKGLHLVGIAEGDVAQHFQHAGGIVCGNAELEQRLRASSQVVQREGGGCCHLADLFQLLSGKLLVSQHDLEVGQVAFHAGVVIHAAFGDRLQGRGRSLDKICNQIPCGDGPAAEGSLRRVAVQFYFAGDAKIGHCVHLSIGARAQWHRLL